MNDKDTLSYLRNFGKKLDDSEFRLKKVEELIKYDPKLGIVIKGPIHYSGGLYPSSSSDIGSSSVFLNNLYLGGKIIYPDALDFGVNNDFRIDKMGKIGFHSNEKLDGVTIKGLSSFAIQNVTYLGENVLFFQINKGSMQDFLTKQDILTIDNIHYQVINVSHDKVEISCLDEKDMPLIVGSSYDMIVNNNLLGVRTNKDEDILKINALGNVFYKTTEKKADITINGGISSNDLYVNNLEVGHITIKDNDALLVANLNAEFLCGKKAPINGDLVSTKDKQQFWNKSFGDDLIMNYNRIVNLQDPLYDMDAVTKRYVDKYLSGIRVSQSVKSASIINLEADYEKKEMKLHLRTSNHLESEELIKAFDGYQLKINDRCLILNQSDEKQNGVYVVISDGIVTRRVVFQRVLDFSNKKNSDELKSYYTFIENGVKYGNTGMVFEYTDDFDWEESPIRFNMFSKAESYGVGNGIKKTRNNFSLNIGDEFELDSGKLELKKGMIGNEFLKNRNINLIGDGGIEIDKSVINLGENVKIGLKIDRKQFHFGKNGELQISSGIKGDNVLPEELNISKNVSAMGFQNVYQLFPPSKFTVQMQYSEDFFEKEKDRVVQYYICSLNSEGLETNYKTSDEIYFTEEAKSVFASIDWDDVKGCDGYIIYRRINSAFSFVKLSKIEQSLLDILVPRNFTKIDWKACDEPDNLNKTVLVVNKFSTLGSNYITGGGLGIGTVKPKGALHIMSNEVNSEGIPLLIEMGEKDKEVIRMIKKGIAEGGVKIVGESMEGTSSVEFGRNIRLTTDAEGVVFLGRSDEVIDINERLGSDTFSVQTTDGGIYSAGDMMVAEGKSFGSFNNKLGNNAAIIKTGCISNSIANQVCFTWEGEELKAVPMYDGSMLTKKKVSVKNFTIQHPVEENKYLVHACLEGPTADVFYRGRGEIRIGTYFVDIELPDYFSKLIELNSSTVNLAPIGVPFFRLGGTVYETQGILRVHLDKSYNEEVRFYWEVKATRKNTSFNVEPLKSDVRVQGFGPYTYYL